MIKRSIQHICIISALVLGAVVNQSRADLVNGGFESGSFSPGWTLLPDAANGGYTRVTNSVDGIAPYEGSYYATFSNFATQGPSGISQVVTTTAGQDYTLSFYFTNFIGSDQSNQFQVTWDGGTLLNLTNFASFNSQWAGFTFDVMGTGSDTVTFSGYQNYGYNGLDDVSLTPTSVPEPPSLVAMLTAIPVALAACRRAAGGRRTAKVVG